jgi:hypothetical protein
VYCYVKWKTKKIGKNITGNPAPISLAGNRNPRPNQVNVILSYSIVFNIHVYHIQISPREKHKN